MHSFRRFSLPHLPSVMVSLYRDSRVSRRVGVLWATGLLPGVFFFFFFPPRRRSSLRTFRRAGRTRERQRGERENRRHRCRRGRRRSTDDPEETRARSAARQEEATPRAQRTGVEAACSPLHRTARLHEHPRRFRWRSLNFYEVTTPSRETLPRRSVFSPSRPRPLLRLLECRVSLLHFRTRAGILVEFLRDNLYEKYFRRSALQGNERDTSLPRKRFGSFSRFPRFVRGCLSVFPYFPVRTSSERGNRG